MPEEQENVNSSELPMLGKYIVLIETKTQRDWVQLCRSAEGKFFVLWGDWQGRDVWKWCEYPCETEQEADETYTRHAQSAMKHKHSRGNVSLEDVLLYEAMNGEKGESYATE